MGLDFVELGMAVEEEFGMKLRDEDASDIRTPAALIDHVLTRIPHADEAPCPSLRGFNLLRAALVRRTGRRRNDIKPETWLKHLFDKYELDLQLTGLQVDLSARSWARSGWPRRPKTVRDLVRYSRTSDRVLWTRPAVARSIRQLVIEQLGLEESEYREDGDFIRDFGAG